MGTMEKTVRQLTEKERRLLTSAMAWRVRRLKSARRRVIVYLSVLFSLFSGVIIIATRVDKKSPPWYYVCLIGWAIAAAIAWWIDHDLRPKLVADVELFEGALTLGEACVMRIQSDAMVEFDEEEDEGACYAFQLDNRQIVFVSGQDFYPSARFPNTDFSLVTVYGNGGAQVASFMEKNGKS